MYLDVQVSKRVRNMSKIILHLTCASQKVMEKKHMVPHWRIRRFSPDMTSARWTRSTQFIAKHQVLPWGISSFGNSWWATYVCIKVRVLYDCDQSDIVSIPIRINTTFSHKTLPHQMKLILLSIDTKYKTFKSIFVQLQR